MKALGKLLTIASIAIATLTSAIVITQFVTKLELQYDIPLYALFTFAIALFITGWGIQKGHRAISIILRFIGMAVLYIITMFMYGILVWDLCVESFSEPIYIHSTNGNKTIVIRDFGCGAVDSSPNSSRTMVYEEMAWIFYRITPIDTTALDKGTWLPMGKH